ncbi:Aminoglycoside phosphotransferase [Ostreococcus tauri]|uniref:Aminoglycoside phosphotransferase n=1 Tax=Ostreococcus tauri TaxID=70448 RepID=A0A096PBF9_OSTTA|nr:Aminoglycoside phosphotransferase [Ostreococcus tauri]CEG01922.1 Aminoglycoside phosphotransferase [Ostreococcus tauri]|eukprot:XP_022841252.1 Aminoglycoside phosphotransferase [Ostreococcus tauri]
MRIVIPACGKGERFRAAGYDTIKPLIKVHGEPMIDCVMRALNVHDTLDEHVVIVNFDAKDINHAVVELDRETLGAAETVLLALQAREGEDVPMLLVDCDAIYHSDILGRFRALEAHTDVRAAVLSFHEDASALRSKPKYSYVAVDEKSDVMKIAEKVRVGPLANTGAYWFASSTEFVKLTQIVIEGRQFQHGEAYVSCVIDEYLRQNKTVRAVIINEDEYSNIGTPDCLEHYLSTQGRAFLFDLDGTLVDTTAAYVRAWHSLLAPKGALVDADFFNTHISGLADEQVREKFKIAISSEEKDEEFLKHLTCVEAIPGAVDFVRKCQEIGPVYVVTNSNKRAADALLDCIGLGDVPLLTASDVKHGKPNPEPYAKAMLTLGVSPRNCVVFEDSKSGTTSARAAGVGFVIAISNNVSGCDAFYENYADIEPNEIIQHLESVAQLSDELTEMFGQRSIVHPVRASGGYISEVLSASCGARKLVVKQENSDHGVLQDVSEQLALHMTECEFYRTFSSMAPVRIPTYYGVLSDSKAIVMEDLRKYNRAPEFTLVSGLKVVQAIATLHSHFQGMNLGKLSEHSAYMKQHVHRNYQRFKARWSGTLSGETMELFDHAAKFYEDAEAQLLRKPCTLLHGDLKFPNLFWDYGVNGGEPIFIDWQYAGPGQGVEDIVFLLVESCEISSFESLAEPLISAYYEERQKLDDIQVAKSERRVQVSCALATFPLFVAVWFGCIDASKLSEPNFPFLYIIRLANAFTHLYDSNWTHYKV